MCCSLATHFQSGHPADWRAAGCLAADRWDPDVPVAAVPPEHPIPFCKSPTSSSALIPHSVCLLWTEGSSEDSEFCRFPVFWMSKIFPNARSWAKSLYRSSFSNNWWLKYTHKFLHIVPEIGHLELLKTVDNNKNPKKLDLKIKQSNSNWPSKVYLNQGTGKETITLPKGLDYSGIFILVCTQAYYWFTRSKVIYFSHFVVLNSLSEFDTRINFFKGKFT